MRLSWQQIPSPLISEMLCQDFDGVVLDTEHGFFNNETIVSCIQIITAHQKHCFVRLTEVNKTLVRLCLDSGATGLIFSTIETMKQADDIKQFCTFPNYGGSRGLGLVRQNFWGYDGLIKKPPIIVVQIETLRGVKNLPEIHKKHNFDNYMIGPYDLSASMGIPAQFDNPKYIKILQNIKSIITNPKQMAVHIPSNVNKEIDKYENYGIIAVGMDTVVLLEGYKELK